MFNKLFIQFGQAYGTWLPINFKHEDFELHFSASFVFNDPIEELYNLLMILKREKKILLTASIKFWLEPQTSIFNFEKEADSCVLTLIEASSFESNEKKIIKLLKAITNKLSFRLKLR